MTDEEQKRIFSNNLNKYILRSGKQQNEIAKAIGAKASTFNMWCKGNSMPGTGKIRALADYFRVGMTDLTDLKEDQDRLEIEIGNKKYTFTYDRAQDAILYDGNYIFKRLSDIAEDDNNAEVRIDAVSGEFLGKWKAVNLENTKGEISVYPDVLKATTVTLEISEKKADKTTGNRAGDLSMDLKIHGDTDKSTISGISSTFTMGAITFQIANPIESSIIETGKRSDGKVFIIENGMLSMTLTDGENRTTLYMTKEAEE